MRSSPPDRSYSRSSADGGSEVLFQNLTTYRQLLDATRRIRESHGDEIVFRGQTAHYDGKVIPSIRREGSSSYLADQHRDWRRFIWWMLMKVGVEYQQYLKTKRKTTKRRAAPQSQPDYPLNAHLDAILQHYGARSEFVDVTRSLDVALWFAHRNYSGATLLVDGMHVSSQVNPPYDLSITAASYELHGPPENAYLFVFAAPDSTGKGKLEHGDFVDLTRGVMSRRMSAQQAGLLYAPVEADNRKLEPLASFEFPVPLKGMPRRVLQAKTSDYFPSPDVDMTYRLILEGSPFIEDYTAKVLRRSLLIPEYVAAMRDSPGPPWTVFREFDKALIPTHIFSVAAEFDRQQIMPFRSEIRGQQYALGDAAGILLRLPSSELLASSVDLDAPVDVPENLSNVFLEYPEFQSLIPYLARRYSLPFTLDNPDGTVTLSLENFEELTGVRGVWIVKSEDEYWGQLFAFLENDFVPYPGFYFRGTQPNSLELVGPRPGNSDAEYLVKATLAALRHSLCVLRQVKRGDLSLQKSADLLFKYHLDNPSQKGWLHTF